MPESVAYLWGWFLELASVGKITFSEIKAWGELKSLRLRPYEVDALIQLETIRRNS